MMKQFFLIVIFLCSLFQNSFSQESIVKKNAAYVELAGSGLIYSVSYDRLLLVDQKMRFSGTFSTWYIPHFEEFSDFEFIIGSSIGLNTLIGKKNHFAELGINVAYWNMKDTEENFYHTIYVPVRLGYRYQRDEGGLFLRLSLMPIISVIQDADTEFLYPVTPHFAIGVGYGF